MRNFSKQVLSFLCAFALLISVAPPMEAQQNPPSNQSYVGGKFVARNYNYPGVRIFSGNNASGVATITLSSGSVTLRDGRTIVPFSAGGFNTLGAAGPLPAIPIMVGAGAVQETVTPTAVSGCYVGAPQGSCSITASFTYAHGQGEVVTSGSYGIQEAVNDAGSFGGGVVSVDSSENQVAGGSQTVTKAMAAALPVAGVSLEDDRTGPPTFWNALAGATTLAAPTTLTSSTVGFAINGANATGGLYIGADTYYTCIAYVDIMGQEGPCSATFSGMTAGTGSTNQIGFSAPAASPGAVGYTVYISLLSGSYNLSYKVPLVSQPSAVGVYPASNGVCTLTTVELATPACAVANTTYNQTGSAAIVSALTLNTSPITPQNTVVSTTSVYVPNAGGRTTYTYTPTSNVGVSTVPSAWLPFAIGTATATVVPDVVGTVNIPPGYMNVLGRKIEICGDLTTTATAATIVDIQFQWDSMGQNTAGKGVLIGDMTATPTAALATAGHATFCQDFETTVTSASATGGTINHTGSFGGVGGLTLIAGGPLTDAMPGANGAGVGSLNLAVDARINIIYLHTTATDGAGWTLQHLTVKQI